MQSRIGFGPIIMIILLIFLISIPVIFSGCGKKGADVIKIGAILPLTGDAALYGQNAKEGIDLALTEVNDNGGVLGRKIEIIYEDSQANPNKGVATCRKLISVDNVSAIIGSITSSVTLAIAPIVEKEKVVLISPAATAPEISDAGDFIFRNWTSDSYEGEVLTEFACKNLGIDKMSILYVNNDYGNGLLKVIREELQKRNSSIVSEQSFNQKDTDFKTQISKIKNSKADGLYIVSYPEEIIIILKQLREFSLGIQLLSTSAFQDRDILSKAGELAEGVIFPYPSDPDPEDYAVKKFIRDYSSKYNKKPGIVCDTGYDALKMLVFAMENQNGFTGERIKDGLYNITEYHGASGIMSFDNNGDVEKIMTIRTVRNGEFENIN